ncbi:hypothetical protein FA09DRAFT_216690 [Tilletiopsis washingtonensis]|jgi:hypothetical protein|uniref:Uncharacterized protein n=1 Tax=Tilletiopsis washingtonensis TaxID=58919 RepID=A0A316ZHH1_9BASI|nr:hypothetical protein FA09DRAFT_216690 [Tilletiopsis washingtonensis]PWN99725.1 hypothetical protein FA09DRAFT_216690 [Tilletiopsis washingtonensis]
MLSGGGNLTAVAANSSSASVLALLLGSAAVALPSSSRDAGSLVAAALPSQPAASRSVLALSLALVLLAALLALCDCLFGSVRSVKYYLSTAGQSSYLRRSLFSGWRPLYSLLATVALAAQGASLLCVLGSSSLLLGELLDVLAFAASILAALLLCLTVVRRGTASTSAVWNYLQRPLLFAAVAVSASGGLALLGFAYAAKQRSVSALLPHLDALVAAAPQPCAADDAGCGAVALGSSLQSIAAATWGLNAMRAAMLLLLAALMLATSLTAQSEIGAAARQAEAETAAQSASRYPSNGLEEKRASSSGFRIFHREPRRAKLQEIDEHAVRRGSVPDAIDEWGASVHMLDYAGSWHADSLSSHDLAAKQRHERRGSAVSAFSSVQGLKLDVSDEMGASLVRKYGSAEDYGASVPVGAYYNHFHRASETRRGSTTSSAARSASTRSKTSAASRSKKHGGPLAGIPLVDASEATRDVVAPQTGTAALLRAERRRLRLDLLFGLVVVGLLALLLALRFAAGDALALGMRPQLRLLDEAAQALLLGVAHAATLTGLMVRGSGGWAKEALPEVQGGGDEECGEKRWRTRRPWDRA